MTQYCRSLEKKNCFFLICALPRFITSTTWPFVGRVSYRRTDSKALSSLWQWSHWGAAPTAYLKTVLGSWKIACMCTLTSKHASNGIPWERDLSAPRAYVGDRTITRVPSLTIKKCWVCFEDCWSLDQGRDRRFGQDIQIMCMLVKRDMCKHKKTFSRPVGT